MTEPPLTSRLSDEELRCLVAAPLQVASYPVHTVAAERALKAVTEAVGYSVSKKRINAFLVRASWQANIR